MRKLWLAVLAICVLLVLMNQPRRGVSGSLAIPTVSTPSIYLPLLLCHSCPTPTETPRPTPEPPTSTPAPPTETPRPTPSVKEQSRR